MSETPTPLVTTEELKQWLWNDRERQEQVADRLFVSPRTIDNWRAGQEIPERYQKALRRMMNGEDNLLLSLQPDTRKRVTETAKRKGYASAEAYLSEFIEKMMLIALVGLMGWQICHPNLDQSARRVGRRRVDSAVGIEMMEEA